MIEWTGQIDEDSRSWATHSFADLQDPDEDMLPALLFWRDARLTHVEALDWSHFADDHAKEQLFHQEVPRLVKERRPQLLSLLLHTRTTSSEQGSTESVLVTIASATRVYMYRAFVSRHPGTAPTLGAWGPFPESTDHEVRSWINDALQSALTSAPTTGGLGRFFGRT